jgi:hypothetical protein
MTRRAQTTALFAAGAALVVAGLGWTATTSQTIDRSWVAEVVPPAFAGPTARPRVFVDAAHYNVHTARGSYAPLVALLRRDGYRVRDQTSPFSTASLAEADLLIVANPLGLRGVIQHTLNLAGLERRVRLRPAAIPDLEVAEVARWVSGGGALLIAADHAPAGEAAQRLAEAFGVGMSNWWVEDADHHDPVTSNPAFVLYTAESGLAVEHSIIAGRSDYERVRRVLTFTGQTLRVPDAAVSLLTLSSSAREYPYRQSREAEGRSAAGGSQAAALRYGRGRVVVLGEAAMLTAQASPLPDGSMLRFGINRTDMDNEQFALNVIHWLSGLLD